MKKALHIAGIRTENFHQVRADASFRMDVADLRAQVTADKAAGLVPFAVIGTCGTTNTGAIDPLNAIADVCEEFDLWFRCDAAYGGSVVLSDRKADARGIERADSIAWDGHKWLFQTYGCALLLVKDVRTLVNSFSAGGEYLQDIQGLAENPDWWDMGPELTRPGRGPRMWLTIQTVGTDRLSRMINSSIADAEHLEQRLRGNDRLEIVTPASLAIVTFSVRADTEEERAARNEAVGEALRRHNIAGIFTTEVEGRNVLRICTISPSENAADLDVVADQISEVLDELDL